MDSEELVTILEGLRAFGGEPSNVEAKAAAGGLPASTVETVSAFSNTNGGVIMLGVDERSRFDVVELTDPIKLRNDLVSAVSDQLTPPVRPAVDLVEVDGRVVVVAEIDPLPSDQRPCYVTTRGIATGSYVRTGDGDRRMTQAEIGLAFANRGQPWYDVEPVTLATYNDLDRSALARMLERVRATSRSLRDVDDLTALRRLRILVSDDDDREVPSLAGILTFGVFPQQFVPQLTVSVVVYPSTTTERTPEGPRFADNPTVRGAIPELISETLAAVRRNLSVREFIDGSGRRDQLDYPMEAVREALVNAVLHRDYSPVTRGTQVQLELHPDRLVVRSPGSLFGPVTVADLGAEGVSSSRNSFLAQILSDTYLPQSDRLIAENRASGIPAMIQQLRRSGLTRPKFGNHPSRFEVEFSRSALMDRETRRWLDRMRQPDLTQLHELALAMMRHGQDVTNSSLREYGADRGEATQVLGELVSRGLARRHGGRRYARYLLAAEVAEPLRDGRSPEFLNDGDEPPQLSTTHEAVSTALARRGTATAAELVEVSGRSRPSVLIALRALVADGLVQAEGHANSPRRSYRWRGQV